MDFTHLHVHSEYSLLDSTCRIESLVDEAKRLGMKALSITDTNVLYGVIPFYNACKKAGIHPVIGMRVQYRSRANQSQMRTKASPNLGRSTRRPIIKQPVARVTLLAKSNDGYQNLVKLSSLIQLSRTKELEPTAFKTYSQGLIVLSGGIHGEIEQALMDNDPASARQSAQFFKELFGSDFYMELQRSGRQQDESRLSLQRKLAAELDIETVVTHSVHYLHPDEALAHQSLSCIRLGLTLDEMTQAKGSGQAYFKTGEEMRLAFPDDQEALVRTTELAEQCQVHFDFDQTYLPEYQVKVGVNTAEYLTSLCQKGLEKRYGTVTKDAQERLNYELSVIDRMGFNDYFLVIWDVIRFARKHGIDPGPGRGSAAGSLVSYTLGITDVDPIHHRLLFERFLNPERVTMPDIDIDFPDHRRDEILHYVQERYGTDYVAQIGTFGTLSAKAALRDLGRILSIKPRDLDRLVAQIPTQQHGITLDKAFQESKSLRQVVQESESYQKLYALARQIEGLPRHTSVHAAGVIINKFPLTDLVPLQEGREGLAVTQFPMDVLESLGLIKMDFLGLRNLTLIEHILANIENEGQAPPSLQSLPLDDEGTFQMLAKGDTDGVFQLESSGMRDVLKKLRPTSFEDIVAVCALYRPGPMQNIPAYIEGKHGVRPIDYPHTDLEPILKPTFGVIVYQEQIMQIASIMAGFSLGEADILRRAVSKKKRDVLEEEKAHFLKGCLNKGYTKEAAEKVYDWIVRFADYGFNRSHAVAYALIAYRLAFLKAHYPGPFMTALLSSVGHHPDKIAEYRLLLNQHGLSLLLPSINKSDIQFSSDPNGVRFGLAGIKNIGLPAVRNILAVRKEGLFKSFEDFCFRVSSQKVNRRQMEALIMAGAMDEFGNDRAHLLASLDLVMERAEEAERDKERGQNSFVSDDLLSFSTLEDVPPFRFEELLAMEKEVLGFYISGHPTEPFLDMGRSWGAGPIQSAVAGKTIRLCVLVESMKFIKTKKGQQMAFGRFSDQTGQIEAVVFPNVLERYRDLLKEGELLFVEGQIEKKKGDLLSQFILEKATRLNQLKSQPQSQIPADKKRAALFLKVQSNQADVLQKVRDCLLKHRGEHPVIVYYEDKGETLYLDKAYHSAGDTETLIFLKKLLGDQNVVLK